MRTATETKTSFQNATLRFHKYFALLIYDKCEDNFSLSFKTRTSHVHSFHFISFIESFTGTNKPNKLTCSQQSGFIHVHVAQLVEHCAGITEVMGSNPFGVT